MSVKGRADVFEAMAILEKNQLEPLVRVNMPEYILIDNSTASGDLRQLICDHERLLARLLREAELHPLQRIASAFRDLAQTCIFLFDEEPEAALLDKAEEAAERTAELHKSTPGLAGVATELLFRAEVLGSIYTRQVREHCSCCCVFFFFSPL